MTLSTRIADFSSTLTVAQLPDDVRAAAGMHALDTVGCGVAAVGLGEADFVQHAAEESHAPGSSSAIGSSLPMSAEDAALVGGVRCHALDYDDTHAAAVTHVSTAVVPAALAAAEEIGASGADVLAALVAGSEVSIRVGTAGAGEFHDRGFHPTGVVGIFGATVAAARVHGLSARMTAHALGLAGSMAGGVLEFLSDGSQTKPLHAGWAARAALSAVRMARHGATGPATVLEGSRGFYATYLHGVDTDATGEIADLGERWETPRIAYKPYAACHFTHAPVDALAALVRREGLGAEDVESIVVYAEPTGVPVVLEPAADKLTPRTAYDAKFSLPYCLAHQLVHGGLPVASFTAPAIADPAVLAITPRVSYEERRYSDRPGSFGGGVRVSLTDGRVLEHELQHQRGGTEFPMTDDEVRAKYRDNASLGLGEEQVDTLDRLLTGLAEAPDLSSYAVVREARPRVEARV
ncbi:2-methylcitrate dehydratase [Marmoricola endophyticus]|uniref:2-methylcitrate dehydratase n=1 Tax=Marmoricola endophyticus TaxID=2040280 RepID=A0A917BPR7_9ACTN|nr:MmgE/PrpD family protein [Marmoricola endophyticus]GGF53121.1 2-methylcitrate dehydratase [Marmoricola endophyticus]